ncbi:MAG: beta-propeller domain-containing protein, partial [Candidatus Hydrothermarchaeales archaeon]
MDGKIITVVLMLTVAGAILVSGLVTEPHVSETNKTGLNQSRILAEGGLKKFNTPEEISSFLKEKTGGYRRYGVKTMDMAVAPMLEKAGAQSALEYGDSAADFSTTNIQVAGVDEADIVKNDGRYIYMLTGNTVSIVDAYPAESAKLLSQIEIRGNAQEIFINGGRLIVLGNTYEYASLDETLEKRMSSSVAPELVEPYPGRMNREYASLHIYNIENREEPVLVRSVSLDGYYFNSRMIGNYVYIIANEYPRYYEGVISVPEVSDSKGAALKPDVYYFDESDYSYSFTTIASVNIQSAEDPVEAKIYLLGSAQNMFVSQKNVYITYQRMMPEPVLYE